MKVNKIWLPVALLVLSGMAFGPGYYGGRCDGSAGCTVRDGGGEIPTPFDAFNQRAELADAEDYLLVGRVVLEPSPDADHLRPFFEVDLDIHRWLATASRKADPRYPLEGSVGSWKQYRGMRIKLPCTADQQITVIAGQKPAATIWLKRSKTNPIEPM